MDKRIIFNVRKKIIYLISDLYIKECYKQKKKSHPISDYIKKSKNLVFFLDKTKSLFDNNYISHNRTLQTDGHWIWSSDLNVYTENYNFIWPDDFLKSINIKKEVSNLTMKDYEKLEAELVISGYYEDNYEKFIEIKEL